MTLSSLRFLYPVTVACRIERQAEASVYLVGGSVRDSILGIPLSNDCDFVVAGRLEVFAGAFAEQVHGKVIPWSPDQIRVAFRHRDATLSVDFSRLQGGDIVRDLRRRDFTINAMAVRVADVPGREEPELIDPCGGTRDLERRIITCCSSASFEDDPLRMLRAVRLAREFSFQIDPATVQEMMRHASGILRISPERIKRELFRILGLPDACRSIRQLCLTGILPCLLPELEAFKNVQQSYPHQDTVFEHAVKTVEQIDRMAAGQYAVLGDWRGAAGASLQETIEEGVTRQALLVFSALLHDSGKSETQRNKNGRTVFYGHEKRGELCNRAAAQRLGLGRSAQKIIGRITREHMRLLHLCLLDRVTERALIRLALDIDDVFWETIILSLADTAAKGAHPAPEEKMKALVERLAGMRDAPRYSELQRPLLDGSEVIALLGIQEGPAVGALLAELHEQERAGRVNSRDDAVQWITAQKKEL